LVSILATLEKILLEFDIGPIGIEILHRQVVPHHGLRITNNHFKFACPTCCSEASYSVISGVRIDVMPELIL
jgi:hypothetical protein